MAKILIVDDSIIMRRNLNSILTQGGHEVVGEATNGYQAFQMYVDLHPDLVTMDITMPVLNGIEATKKIIAHDPKATIVMISALDQKVMVFDALQNGAKNYIIKPITVEKILTTVEQELQKAQVKETVDTDLLSVPPTVQKEKEPKITASFTIENLNGIFVISIHRVLSDSDILNIQTAIQGFLFIKPLQIYFHITTDELLNTGHEQILLDCMKKIVDVNGSVKLVTKNEKLLNSIRQTLPEVICEQKITI